MRIFSYEELDELGEGLIRQYLGKEAERTCCVDIEGFVTDFLKLPLLYRSFAEEDSDKIGFIADGVTPLRVYENGAVVRRVYPGGTIVIERCHLGNVYICFHILIILYIRICRKVHYFYNYAK